MSVAISDPRIVRLGRWNDTGAGIWSAWGGSQLRFRVSGATVLTINANVVCATGKLCICECVIDDAPADSLQAFFANNENFSGARSVSFALPSTGEHDITIKTNGYNADIFNGLSRSVVTSIDVGAGAILPPVLGPKLIQCIGDSWMAADADWPRLMDQEVWRTYQIATGGLKVSDMNAQYAYSGNGIPAVDPAADAAMLSYGVNDYLANMSLSTYQANLLALVDQVRTRQSCPLFLIQTPRNLVNGRTYDQYGPAMQAVASARSGVTYIPTSDIWAQLTWQSDGAHLDAGGKKIFASFIDDKIKCALSIYVEAIRINGEPVLCTTIPTSRIYLRVNGLGIVSMPSGIGWPH